MKEKTISTKMSIIIAFVIAILVLGIGITYAYFAAQGGTATQTVTSGTLSVSFTTGEILRTENLIPIKETDIGAKATEINFTVENTGNVVGYFNISLTDIVIDKELENEDFKWRLLEGETIVNEGNFIGVETSKLLQRSIAINGGGAKTYKILVWIQESGEAQNEMQGKNLTAKVTVAGKDRLTKFALSEEPVLADTISGNSVENLKIYGNTVDDVSVGEGNLFDDNYIIYGQAWLFSNGASVANNSYLCNANFIPVTSGEVLTLSAEGNLEEVSSGFVFYKNGVFVSSKTGYSATVPEGANQVRINLYLVNSEVASADTIKNISLTSNKNNIYITTSGANVTNFSRATTTVGSLTGTITSYTIEYDGDGDNHSRFLSTNDFYLPAGTYTLSMEQVSPTDSAIQYEAFYLYKKNTWDYSIELILQKGKNNTAYGTFTLENARNLQIGAYIRESQIFYDYKARYKIVRGSTPDYSFEPYQEPVTYTISLSAPLRSNGNKKDYIDFNEGKVIRLIAEDGSVLQTPTEETITLPEIKTLNGTTTLSTSGEVKPAIEGNY